MVVVAVAGGAGEFGRTLLEALEALGEHNAIVFSRTARLDGASGTSKHLAVDYTNVDQLKQVLRENKVDVVVSTLVLLDEDASQAQINLIRAAALSGTVDRFIPTEYYINYHTPVPGPDLFCGRNLKAEQELLCHPQLSWTLVRNGVFLDHLMMPHNPIKTNISPYWVFVDVDHEQCVLPGDGSNSLILSHSRDVAAYVARLVGLPAKDWPRESLIASNKLQVKDLAFLVAKATGREFRVKYDSEEEVSNGEITPLPSNQHIFSDPSRGDFMRKVEQQLMLSVLSNGHDLPGRNLAEFFPDVQPTKIEDFFRAGWQKKQVSDGVDV